MEKFAERVKILLMNNNESAKELFPKLGLSYSSMTHWKKGKKPSIDAILILSDYFNVSIDFLLKGEKAADELDIKEKEWLELYRKIQNIKSFDTRNECIGFIKGYVQAFSDLNKEDDNSAFN